MRNHLTPSRMDIILKKKKKTKQVKKKQKTSFGKCEEIRILMHYRIILFKTELPYDPAIPLLDIYQKNGKQAFASMFIVA